MASTEIEFIPDFDQLDQEIQDEDFTAEVEADVEGGGGAGGGIAEALGFAEIGSDIGTGAGKGGIFGKLAGSLSSVVLLLGSVVAFLALLEPIQQAIGFLVRQFELLVVPLVAALRPVLEAIQKLAVAAINLFRNPEQFLSNIFNKIKQALAPFVNAVISGLNNVLGLDISPVSTGSGTTQIGPRSTGETDSKSALEQLSTSTAGSLATAGATGAGLPVYYLLSDDAANEKSNNRSRTGDNIG